MTEITGKFPLPPDDQERRKIPANTAIQVSYDWRVFKPNEYLVSPAGHNTGRSLIQEGVRRGFVPGYRVDEMTYRSNLEFKSLPEGIPPGRPDAGVVIANLHQPAFAADFIRAERLAIDDKKSLISRLLRKKEARTIPEERMFPAGILTADKLLVDADTERSEPVIVSEIRIVLPRMFLKEIELGIPQGRINLNTFRDLCFVYFTTKFNDEQLGEKPVSKQIQFFTELLIYLLQGRGADPDKIAEFSGWLKEASTLRYNFESNVLTPIE